MPHVTCGTRFCKICKIFFSDQRRVFYKSSVTTFPAPHFWHSLVKGAEKKVEPFALRLSARVRIESVRRQGCYGTALVSHVPVEREQQYRRAYPSFLERGMLEKPRSVRRVIRATTAGYFRLMPRGVFLFAGVPKEEVV